MRLLSALAALLTASRAGGGRVGVTRNITELEAEQHDRRSGPRAMPRILSVLGSVLHLPVCRGRWPGRSTRLVHWGKAVILTVMIDCGRARILTLIAAGPGT